MGVNGVGKSTLLRTLSGFQPALKGCMYMLDRSMNDYATHELAQAVAVVLTDKPDVEHLTVRELVALGRTPYTGFWGKLTASDCRAVEQAMESIHIETLADRLVNTLSDGERQKALIAKALAQETPIIILDEPTAFLDFPSKIELMQLLRDLCRQLGKTIFLSTHDVELTLRICDRLWLMNRDGIVIHAPDELSGTGILEEFFQVPEDLFRAP
jgi:iron complex transport system ATP-binding protein